MEAKDREGERFGKLVVIKKEKPYISPSGRKEINWLCKCDCGNKCIVRASNLVSGHTVSCGCARKGVHTKHGDAKYKNASRLYAVWATMLQRCTNENNKSYFRYGGRGIKVCNEWHEYKNFKKWAESTGYNENAKYGECTIDRINVDGDYTPKNCKWSTAKEQANNRRSNVKYKLLHGIK